MPNYKVDIPGVAKASMDYDTAQDAVYTSLNTMRTNIEQAIPLLRGAAVNGFAQAKAQWEAGAAKIHSALDEGAAALGQTARNVGVNEDAIAQWWGGPGVAPGVTAVGGGKRLGAGMEYASVLDNIWFDAGTVDDFRTSMTQCRTKLESELAIVNGVARGISASWEATSHQNYQGWHTKWRTGFEEIQTALRTMITNADGWMQNSNGTETTNQSMWGA